jgi:hypothetical protein
MQRTIDDARSSPDEILLDHPADFRARINLLRVRRIIREALVRGDPVFDADIVERQRPAGSGIPAFHLRSIDDDARQPGGKPRAAFKALQVTVG